MTFLRRFMSENLWMKATFSFPRPHCHRLTYSISQWALIVFPEPKINQTQKLGKKATLNCWAFHVLKLSFYERDGQRRAGCFLLPPKMWTPLISTQALHFSAKSDHLCSYEEFSIVPSGPLPTVPIQTWWFSITCGFSSWMGKSLEIRRKMKLKIVHTNWNWKRTHSLRLN